MESTNSTLTALTSSVLLINQQDNEHCSSDGQKGRKTQGVS